MNTKKMILLALWLAGTFIMLPAQELKRDIRLNDDDASSLLFFPPKPNPTRGETLLLPEKGYCYYFENLEKPERDISYFYDEKGTLKTQIRKALIDSPYLLSMKIVYNQMQPIDGINMPDTATYYQDAEMTKLDYRIYWNWKLYEVSPIDSFYFEQVWQVWDSIGKKWYNYEKYYYGFIDTVLWELNRLKEYQGNGANGWSMIDYDIILPLYDDNGFVTGIMQDISGNKYKSIYDLNEDGSVRTRYSYRYDSENQPVLISISEFEWQEWNGYGGMHSLGVVGGDGLFSKFPWMKLRNKKKSYILSFINEEGEKEFYRQEKKYWNIDAFGSNIDTTFASRDGSPDNLYILEIEENRYDSYGNYILYNCIGYMPPNGSGHQEIGTAAIRKWDHHYADYGEHGVGCDTAMHWRSNWLGNGYEMVFQWADIITQYVGFTVGIEQLTMDNGQLKIAPNPTSGAITISAASEIEQLQIFDITGRLVHSQTPANKEVVFDTGILAKGVYLVQALLRDGEVQRGKIVKN